MNGRRELVVSWMAPVPIPERDASPPLWPRLLFFALFWFAARALHDAVAP